MSRRLGVLGGSFDPIHVGHLRSAEEVREAQALESVLFVPAAHPPHKQDRPLTDGALRLRMVELAISDNPSFIASAIEIERGGTSYSVDTLGELRRREPDAELHFIVGMDAFREMHTWRDCERIFELATVVVTDRPPATVDHAIDHLPVAARKSFCYVPGTGSYRHESGGALRFQTITGIDVSATSLRAAIRRGRSVRYLLPPSVERFVIDRELYAKGDDRA
ncbi:MAG: nicotinate-nucleotide adenylyltransferase [Candidatus Binatota bacterium]|nr:nicotinate-nucleotide adenylyltransferase [Candidatus Binatota bacterium]